MPWDQRWVNGCVAETREFDAYGGAMLLPAHSQGHFHRHMLYSFSTTHIPDAMLYIRACQSHHCLAAIIILPYTSRDPSPRLSQPQATVERRELIAECYEMSSFDTHSYNVRCDEN